MPQGEGIDPVLLFFGTAQTIMSLGILTTWFFTPLYTIVTPTCSVSITPWGIIIKSGAVVRTLGTDLTLTILVLLALTTILSLAGTLLRAGELFIASLGTSVCAFMTALFVIYTITTLLVGNLPLLYFDSTLVFMLPILTILAMANATTR
jgi:hypothetical protein